MIIQKAAYANKYGSKYEHMFNLPTSSLQKAQEFLSEQANKS